MVQHMAELGEPPSDGSKQYTAVECLACGRMHFMNVATGKLLSDEDGD